MTQPGDKEDIAFKKGVRALKDMVDNSTVCLVYVTPGNEHATLPTEQVSGIVVSTPKGRPVILTVRHLWGDEPKKLHIFGNDFRSEPLDAVHVESHPRDDQGEVDVTVIAPSPALTQVLRPKARSPDMIAESATVSQHEWLVLLGYPYEYRHGVSHYSRYCLSSNRIDPWNEASTWAARGCVELPWVDEEWSKPVVLGTDMTFEPATTPAGMSGGGLWRCTPRPEGALFQQDKMMRIIGIQRGFNKPRNVLFVEPVNRWREWVLEEMARIDERGV